jgi:hypothetical protein
MKEQDFTDAVACIASRNDGFALALARTLLHTVIDTSPSDLASKRATSLARRLPRTRALELRSEVPAINDKLRDIWRNVYWSEFDWLFCDKRVALVVEVKIKRKARFNIDQLWAYHRALTDKRNDWAGMEVGLLTLTLTPIQKPDKLGVRRHQRYLGEILWRDTLSCLRRISLSSADDETLWHELLDVVDV